MTNTDAAYNTARTAITAALKGTDKDHRMTTAEVDAIVGELPAAMVGGVVGPLTVLDVSYCSDAIRGNDDDGFYLGYVRHNGRS